jgi:hypothetical protein
MTGTNLDGLISAFGAALVPLKSDALTRGQLLFGSAAIPLSQELAAESRTLSGSDLAGVLCGGVAGLLALVFSSVESAVDILAANPALAGTLVTRLGTALVVWLKPLNRLPPSTALEGVLIITAGLVPVHGPVAPIELSVYHHGHPKDIDLETLVCTSPLKEFFNTWSIQERFGAPVIKVGRRVALNPAFWAVKISKDVGLGFDPNRGAFLGPGNPDTLIETSRLPGLIAGVLQHARSFVPGFPPDEPRPKTIRCILDSIRMFCAIQRPSEAEALRSFVLTCLEPKLGGAVTVNEVTARFLQLRPRFGMVPQTENQTPDGLKSGVGLARGLENRLRHNLKVAIIEHFGVRESHDVHINQRGFHNLALRLTPKDTDTARDRELHRTAPDGTDTPDALNAPVQQPGSELVTEPE